MKSIVGHRTSKRVWQALGICLVFTSMFLPHPTLAEEGYVWRVMESQEGSACLNELGVDLYEIRPGKNTFFMVQRGLGWNHTDYYASLTVDIQYRGEFTSEGGGRTEPVNKTTKLQVQFEPHSQGHFESVVTSVFRLPPRPGWDIDGVVVPGSARCQFWPQAPSSFSKDRKSVVLRTQ